MKEYRTIIVINQEIYKKVELYRKFLEKSEFEGHLDNAIFLAENSVEGLPSTELNKVRNFVYLFGIINKETYEAHYKAIEEKRKKYQNAVHYMLFCQDPYQEEAYDKSEKAVDTVPRTFAIGIVDEELAVYDDSPELKEDLNCLKLLALAMAICRFNEGKESAHFFSYYMCTAIKLDYQNIYYAIIHDLCSEAELINRKELEIKKSERMIALLKEKNACVCKGKYGPIDVNAPETGIKSAFSDYKSIIAVHRELEASQKLGSRALEDDVSRSIEIARRALAVEEMYQPEFELKENGSAYELEIHTDENYSNAQRYMEITEIPKEQEAEEMPEPEELLKKPINEDISEIVGAGAVLSLAGDFDTVRRFNPWLTLLTAFGITVLFAAVMGLIYFVRYKLTGFMGVTLEEIIGILAIPSAAIAVVGLIGLIIQLIRYIYCRSVFKKVYASLKGFIGGRLELCRAIREYIDKYLTVYYNYHIKHSRIEKLEEEKATLEFEIKRIRDNVSPSNYAADTVCLLFGERLHVPELAPLEDGSNDVVATKKKLECLIKTSTVISGESSILKTVSPWASEIHYSVGNMNSGSGR